MADDTTSNETAAAGANGEAKNEGDAGTPSINVLVQYIKDLSFENPNAPQSYRPRETSPEINININVNATPLSDTDFEVELLLDTEAAHEKDVLFKTELAYAGVFRLNGIPQETIAPALLIECPRMLFPFARQIIADATRNGGYPPVMIDPVDFAGLFQKRMQEEAVKSQMEAASS